MQIQRIYRAVIGGLICFGLPACGKPEQQSGQVSASAEEPSLTPAASENTSGSNALAQETVEAPQARLTGAASDPVAAIVERAELCIHFGGEEGFDEARRAQINKAFEDNKCDSVVADGDALKALRPGEAVRIDEALASYKKAFGS
jgi:hypothetical protein